MRRVIVESPYAGNAWQRWRNGTYARRCLLDCLRRGEAPWASHLLYPQALRDGVANERALGIAAGLAWGEVADATVVYTDRGISAGMRLGIEAAKGAGRAVEYRSLRVRKKGGLTRALVAQMGLRKSKKAPRGNLLRRACAQERFPSGAPVAQIARLGRVGSAAIYA